MLRVSARQVVKIYIDTFKQLKFAMLTIASMLGLAYLMNYSGMTSTLGLALAASGVAFPFFSAVVGWLGVFLTGSDTSANALFGNLQVVTANALGLNPILTASVNSAAGVMGKMISVQSIAVAVAATGMTARGREPAVPLHHQAQRPADGRDGRHLDAVRLRVSRRHSCRPAQVDSGEIFRPIPATNLLSLRAWVGPARGSAGNRARAVNACRKAIRILKTDSA